MKLNPSSIGLPRLCRPRWIISKNIARQIRANFLSQLFFLCLLQWTTMPEMITPARYLALDALRGLTIAMMILVNTPGSWDFVYTPLMHADWHGCSPTDLVFPFFLFVVG